MKVFFENHKTINFSQIHITASLRIIRSTKGRYLIVKFCDNYHISFCYSKKNEPVSSSHRQSNSWYRKQRMTAKCICSCQFSDEVCTESRRWVHYWWWSTCNKQCKFDSNELGWGINHSASSYSASLMNERRHLPELLQDCCINVFKGRGL